MSSRPLSLHERWSLTRSNVGTPPHVSVLASFPAPAAPALPALQARAEEIQARYPLLCARLARAGTEPVFVPGSPRGGDEVVRRVQQGEIGGESSDGEREAAVLAYALEQAARGAIDAGDRVGPLWAVLLVLPEPAADADADARVHVVSTVHHVVADGVGALRLLHALLAPALDPAAFPPDAFDVPRLDDTLDLRPGLAALLPAAARALLVPRLPAFARRLLAPAPVWPGALALPPDAPTRVAALSLDAHTVAALAAAATMRGVRTLHPVLQAAAAAALWAALPPAAARITTTAPASERAPALGHGSVTGNYVSEFKFEHALGPGPGAAADVWALARDVSGTLDSPSCRAAARQGIGMLAHVPKVFTEADRAGTADAAPGVVATGWEPFLTSRRADAAPFGASLELSNLGRTALPAGASAVRWAQHAAAPGAPVCLNVLGSRERGVAATLTWTEGAGCDAQLARAVCEGFCRIVKELADGGDGVVGRLKSGEAA